MRNTHDTNSHFKNDRKSWEGFHGRIQYSVGLVNWGTWMLSSYVWNYHLDQDINLSLGAKEKWIKGRGKLRLDQR